MTGLEYGVAEGSSQVALRGSYGLFIGGSFVSGSAVFKTISPASEEVLAEVTHAGPEDVDRAVAAARQAYERTWSVMSGRERGKYLFRIARLIQERARELAVLETLDNGKPIRESRDVDVPLAAALGASTAARELGEPLFTPVDARALGEAPLDFYEGSESLAGVPPLGVLEVGEPLVIASLPTPTGDGL